MEVCKASLNMVSHIESFFFSKTPKSNDPKGRHERHGVLPVFAE